MTVMVAKYERVTPVRLVIRSRAPVRPTFSSSGQVTRMASSIPRAEREPPAVTAAAAAAVAPTRFNSIDSVLCTRTTRMNERDARE